MLGLLIAIHPAFPFENIVSFINIVLYELAIEHPAVSASSAWPVGAFEERGVSLEDVGVSKTAESSSYCCSF